VSDSSDEIFGNWTIQVRKGVLDLCILNALQGRERYGYELVKELTRLPGFGVTEGTLYPLLSRLRLQGLVKTRLEESNEGPARKYYTLTPAGRRVATLMNDYLSELIPACRALRQKD
jgi:PadR family transcriptional regulator, regulatory protein PadR